MNCFERNTQYLKLYPGFNRKPIQTTKKVSIYHIICKTIETLILDVSNNSFPGPSIIATFGKRAGPGL